MTTDPTQTVPSLHDAVRALARGNDLDSTLDELARQARAASQSANAAILLADPATSRLTSLDGEPVDVSDDASDALAIALVDRRPVWQASLPPAVRATLGGASVGAIVPLIREDAAGATLEGVLLLGGPGDRSGPSVVPDATREIVMTIADLAAVAISQERLRSAADESVAYHDRLSRIDPLTGLADRYTFEQMLELELARAARHPSALAVIVFDVDGLAAVNHQHGAGVGDDILRRVAATLADQVRLVDTIARLGPDEFGVIALGDPSGTVAVRVRDAIAAMAPVGSVAVTVHAGIAHHPADGTTGEELMATASRLVIEAGAQGPGTVVGHRPSPKVVELGTATTS